MGGGGVVTTVLPNVHTTQCKWSIGLRSRCNTVLNRIYSCIVLRLVWAEVLEGGSGSERWGQQSKD